MLDNVIQLVGQSFDGNIMFASCISVNILQNLLQKAMGQILAIYLPPDRGGVLYNVCQEV